MHEVGETSSKHCLHFGELVADLRITRIRRALDAEPHHPGARRYAPAAARASMAGIEPAIPERAWRATLHLAENDDEETSLGVWRAGLGETITLETRRTQARDRDDALESARALTVNRDEDGRPRWAPVRLAAHRAVVLDQRLVDKPVAADRRGARRRRRAGR